MAAAPESASWPTAEPGYLVGRGHAGDDLVDVVDLFVASFGQDVLAGGVVRFGQLGTPKSHQSRTVPLPRFVAVELAAGVDGKRPDDLVFTMPGGSVMRLSNWRYVTFLPARARAGLSDRFRIHDLRHTAASLMKVSGVALAASFGSLRERRGAGLRGQRGAGGEGARAGRHAA
jgi:hypothetical protein